MPLFPKLWVEVAWISNLLLVHLSIKSFDLEGWAVGVAVTYTSALLPQVGGIIFGSV